MHRDRNAGWRHRSGRAAWRRGRAREMAEAGCLFSYSASIKDMWYRSASFVDKILKGAKPADLPVQQGTKFEFVVNLKTARALGFDVPPILLARADEVIE